MNDSFIPSSQLGAATGSPPGGLWGEPESQVDENGDAFQECDSDDTETVINMPVQNEQKKCTEGTQAQKSLQIIQAGNM